MNESIKLGDGYWAFKENALLAYNDENNNFKPIDLNSTRASSATRVNKLGLIESVNTGVPRVDYLNNPKGSLLVEPQSTNLVTYSEDFSNVSWTKASGGIGSVPIVTANAGISPSGTTTADRIQFTLNGGTAGADISDIRKLIATTSGTYTFSFWVKSFDGVSSYQMLVRDPNGITNQMVVTGEWQRYTITAATYPTGNASVGFGIRGGQTPVNSGTADILVWGAQLEALPYASSYIPTVASTVTRVEETASKTGLSDYINSVEGVLFVEIASFKQTTGALSEFIQISDGTINNEINIGFSALLTNKFRIGVKYNGVSNFSNYSVSNIMNYNKIALLYSATSTKIAINGTIVASLSGGTFSGTLQRLGLSIFSGTLLFYGKVKSLKVFKTTLSDAQLIALTQ
jgi:hypothetical protein